MDWYTALRPISDLWDQQLKEWPTDSESWWSMAGWSVSLCFQEPLLGQASRLTSLFKGKKWAQKGGLRPHGRGTWQLTPKFRDLQYSAIGNKAV